MRYTMQDLEARSGLTSRTIRGYIKDGYLAPPKGHGLAASYAEEQLLGVVTIARMRARRAGWTEVAQFLADSSLAQLRAFVRKTAPAPPPAEIEPSAAEEPASLAGEPARRGLPPSDPARTHRGADLASDERAPELDDATTFAMASVLPGLALFLRADASPLVKRVAAEILRKYRAR